MSSQEIHNLSTGNLNYQNKKLVQKQILKLCVQIRSLKTSIDTYVFVDCTQHKLLKLTGTIPIQYRSKQYNTPVELWLPLNFPRNCPICYVTPKSGMEITQKHRYVDSRGLIHHPYLREWKSSKSTLVALIDVLCSAFAKEPPLFATSTSTPQQVSKAKQSFKGINQYVQQATTEEIKYEQATMVSNKGLSLYEGQPILCTDTRYKNKTKRYEAEITQAERDKVFVVFNGYKASHGDWIPKYEWDTRITTNPLIVSNVSSRSKDEKYKKKKKKLRQEVTDKDQRIMQLNRKYDKLQQTYEGKYEGIEGQILQLRQKVTHKDERIIRVNRKYNKLQQTYKEQILQLRKGMNRQYKEQILQLRQEVTDKDEHILRVNRTYNELQQKYNEQLKCCDYLTWDYFQIANWIISIDHLKYNKYYQQLINTMKKDGVDGSCLEDLNKHDLCSFGVTAFKDKKDIYNAIQDLIRKTKRMKELETKTIWLHKSIIKWTTHDVLQWLISLNLPNKLYYKIVYEIENESGCTGADINSLTSARDVGNAFGIKSDEMLCDKIFTEIKMLKQQSKCDVEQKIDNDSITKKDDTFEINIFSQDKYIVLSEKVRKNVRIESIKQMYKKQSGVDANINDIHFYSKLKLLQSNKTLEDVNIIDEKHLITVKFGVNGADPQQYSENDTVIPN